MKFTVRRLRIHKTLKNEDMELSGRVTLSDSVQYKQSGCKRIVHQKFSCCDKSGGSLTTEIQRLRDAASTSQAHVTQILRLRGMLEVLNLQLSAFRFSKKKKKKTGQLHARCYEFRFCLEPIRAGWSGCMWKNIRQNLLLLVVEARVLMKPFDRYASK